MNEESSIKQNTLSDTLPNFRNLGVTLRILLISNGLALLQALSLAGRWAEVPQFMMQIASLLTPILLSALLLLWVAQPWLNRLAYLHGVLAVNVLAAVLTLSIHYFGSELYHPQGGEDAGFDMVRYTLLSVLVCSILLMYFRWRSQVLSRALHDARLQVLRARIRPHFLFNTINAVLGIVRTQPKQAETALEDLTSRNSALSAELELTKQQTNDAFAKVAETIGSMQSQQSQLNLTDAKLAELTDHLLARAGERQVAGGRLGAAHTLGGPGVVSTVAVLGAP